MGRGPVSGRELREQSRVSPKQAPRADGKLQGKGNYRGRWLVARPGWGWRTEEEGRAGLMPTLSSPGAAGSCGDRHLQPGISGGTHLRKIPPAEAGGHGVGMTQGMPLTPFPAG